MEKIKVVAFVGKAGSGKTTAAKYLVEQYGYQRLSFSDGLKRMLYKGLEIDSDYLYGDKKDKACDDLCGVSGRHAMITLGTEWGRELIHPDIWVNFLSRQLEKWIAGGERLFVIDDVRFLNEAVWVNKLHDRKFLVGDQVSYNEKIGLLTNVGKVETESKLIVIKRQTNLIQHQSELEQDKIKADVTVYNTGTIGDLYGSLNDVLNRFINTPVIDPIDDRAMLDSQGM